MSWNERYDREEYVFGTEPNAFLKSCSRLLKPGQTALAVADGEGRNGVWLASQGLRVVGFDASAVGLAKARRLAAREGVGVDYRLASVEDWAWERDGYDVVAAIFIQFAEPLLRALIFEGMIRTLKPGGLLLLQGYTPRQLDYGTGGPRAVENLYTRPMAPSPRSRSSGSKSTTARSTKARAIPECLLSSIFWHANPADQAPACQTRRCDIDGSEITTIELPSRTLS
jgi:SAM-dependent methyltransferase